jgi:hypothetical protein
MAVVNPLPVEIAIPKIPEQLPKPIWTQIRPKTWTHPPIPVEIEFPVRGPKKVQLPIKIEVPGVGTFEVLLNVTAVERAQSPG